MIDKSDTFSIFMKKPAAQNLRITSDCNPRRASLMKATAN